MSDNRHDNKLFRVVLRIPRMGKDKITGTSDARNNLSFEQAKECVNDWIFRFGHQDEIMIKVLSYDKNKYVIKKELDE